MEEVLNLLSSGDITHTIISAILLILAIKGFYEFVKWVNAELNNWYSVKSQRENIKESFEERLTSLEEDNLEQAKRIENIDNALGALNEKIDILKESTKETTVSQARASLYRLYDDFRKKPSITVAEYETFSQLAEVYLKNGGNSVFKTKIIPFIKEMPIED